MRIVEKLLMFYILAEYKAMQVRVNHNSFFNIINALPCTPIFTIFTVLKVFIQC